MTNSIRTSNQIPPTRAADETEIREGGPLRWILGFAKPFLLIWLAGLLSTNGSAQGEIAPVSAATVLAPQPVAVSDILMTIDESAKFLKSLIATIDAEQKKPDRLAGITKEISDLAARLSDVSKAGTSQLTLRVHEADWLVIEKNLAAIKANLAVRATSLEEALTRIDTLSGRWKATLATTGVDSIPPQLIENIRAMTTELESSRKRVITERDDLLQRQETAVAQEGIIELSLGQIQKARQASVDDLFTQNNPPLWKAESLSKIQTAVSMMPTVLIGQWGDFRNYLSDHRGRLLLQGAIFVLLWLIFHSAGRKMKGKEVNESRGTPQESIFDSPLATSLFIAVLCGIGLYPLPPPIWSSVIGVIAMILAVRIVSRRPGHRFRLVLFFIFALFCAERLCDLAENVPSIERILFLISMLAGIVFLLWLYRFRLTNTSTDSAPLPSIYLARNVTLVILALFCFAFIADILGFYRIARMIGHGITSSAALAVAGLALLYILNNLLVFAIRSRPVNLLAMTKQAGSVIERRCLRALRFIAVAGWGLVTLDIFSLLNPLYAFLKSIFTISFKIRNFQISLMDFILFGAVVYLSILASRFIRFVLKEEVYPRSEFPKGVPFAVSAVIHYVILIIGFFIALGLAGIDLTRITVLVGALGVGIGFGLQNIVNNFVSGLILLFERPLNVGDMVEVNGQFGELRHIGLRASVLRTQDGSEIIVPNGDLISNPVTNWTLNDQQRRIEIAVGVAYGTDPAKVNQLLLSVAADHPSILKLPEPQALFMSFGESSLDFVLRAWTNEYKRWPQISSELRVGVNRVLADAHITIPFPQRDLHLISGSLPREDQKTKGEGTDV